MELLSELIYILKRNNVYPGDEILPKGSKTRKLFNVIAKGKASTDEEAAQIIYEGSSKDKKYLMLKRNLVKTLTELVFKTNTSEQDYINYQKFLFKGKKELMIAEKLLTQNVYHNAEKITLKVKAYAEKFQFLELQIDCVKHLRTVYTLKGYPKEVEFYNIILKKLNKFFRYEQEAMGLLNLLESRIKFSIGKYREIAVEASRHSLQIKEWQKESANPALRLYQYKIDLIRCYHMNDSREWHFTLTRLSDLIHQYPFLKTESLMLYINVEWARYFRYMADIPEAFVYIEKALRQSDYAAFNKFEVQAIHFDLKIKEKNYEQAGKILREVQKCPQFYLLDSSDQAAWLLLEAYLYFIFLSQHDQAAIEKYTTSFTSGFSVSDLVNSCKAICKDKKGYNFMLVIIKEALIKHKYQGETESAGNNLLVYYQRYMKDSCEDRSRDFMKKFARAAKSNFSLEGLNKEGKTINAGKIAPKNYDAPELIPFENIYELLILRKTEKITED